ncbi:hypothetical protein P7C70_g9350, partial [Phenoliferia sp. Uapishka_3]
EVIPPTIPLSKALLKRAEGADGSLLDPSDENHPSHPSTTGVSGIAPVKKGRKKSLPAPAAVVKEKGDGEKGMEVDAEAGEGEKEKEKEKGEKVKEWAEKTALESAGEQGEIPAVEKEVQPEVEQSAEVEKVTEPEPEGMEVDK